MEIQRALAAVLQNNLERIVHASLQRQQIVGLERPALAAPSVPLCQEYVLQTERITYRIRPKDDKHPVLLPVGETAQFRIHKDKLLLRVPEADGKEREYLVLSMIPRSDVAASSRPASRGGTR